MLLAGFLLNLLRAFCGCPPVSSSFLRIPHLSRQPNAVGKLLLCKSCAKPHPPSIRKYCEIGGSAIGPILATGLLMSQHNLLELPPTTKDKAWRVVIETPRGSHNKYNLEPK